MASTSPAPETALRSSGRVRKQPVNYASSPAGGSKRKRNTEDANENVEDPDEDSSDEDEEDDDDELPDEEELREQRAKARKAKTTKRPAAKKPKTNGTSLPVRSGPGVPRKRAPKKAKGIAGDDAEAAGGLYAEVFASGDTLESVAANWVKSFEEHASGSVADLVNFVLRCAGCTGTVDPANVEDPDGVTNKLDDLRDEYQASNPTDYPLIARGKATAAFKKSVTGFFDVLIKTIAASGHIFSAPELMENIEVWLSTMSSAPNRSFRHTATVCSLSVVTAMCEVARDNAQEISNHQSMVKTESRKARPNKSRIAQMEITIKEKQQGQEYIEALLNDWFDTVFIHRYRDVDPIIRRECISALGDWLITMPSVFFDGQHLRYLGWVLSDPTSASRSEVLKQLQRLYKDKDRLGGLKTFTEKFRPRMVEMATNDSEVHVRVSGIELLGCLRDNGLLEPDDIDAVGRLVFDSEVRIRNAVGQFFAENIQDLYNSKIDDLGGSDALDEVIPKTADGNHDAPTMEWLKFKSLAEILQSYDSEDTLPDQMERSRGDGRLAFNFAHTDSRFVLAAESLYPWMDELEEWQTLAGYLLFDHSARSGKKAKTNDTVSQFKRECKLDDTENAILLEVLNACVKRALLNLTDNPNFPKARLTKKQKDEFQEQTEDIARQTAALIPRLLKRFGDTPSTAAAVLRTESVLDIPELSEFRQDSSTYETLLDNVRKQFMSHGTDDVLGPASSAILHAKSYGELDDVTEEKVTGLWEDVVNNLADLLNPETITVRAATSVEELTALSNNLLRFVRLSSVSDCVPSLEDDGIASTDDTTGIRYEGAIDYIIALTQRAVPATGPQADADESFLEDQIASRAAEASLLYFMWKLRSIVSSVTTGSGVPDEDLEPLATRRDAFVDNVKSALNARKASEDVSVALSNSILQLFSSTAILRDVKPKAGVSDDYTVLFMKIDPKLQKSIMKVFGAAEKKYAKLGGKKLEDAPVDDDEMEIDADPIDDDPVSEPESDSEDEDDATSTQKRKESKAVNTLLAEQKLCALTGKIIHAVVAEVIDEKSTRKRLERNKTKLGSNYKECCAYLDLGKEASSKSKSKTAGKSAAKPKKSVKSNAIVANDEIDDEIEESEDENQELVDDGEPDEDEADDANAGADGEVESLLGD